MERTRKDHGAVKEERVQRVKEDTAVREERVKKEGEDPGVGVTVNKDVMIVEDEKVNKDVMIVKDEKVVAEAEDLHQLE